MLIDPRRFHHVCAVARRLIVRNEDHPRHLIAGLTTQAISAQEKAFNDSDGRPGLADLGCAHDQCGVLRWDQLRYAPFDCWRRHRRPVVMVQRLVGVAVQAVLGFEHLALKLRILHVFFEVQPLADVPKNHGAVKGVPDLESEPSDVAVEDFQPVADRARRFMSFLPVRAIALQWLCPRR